MTFCKLGFRVAERLSDLSTLSRIVFHIFTKCPSSESTKHRSTDTHLHTFQVQSNVNTSAFIIACHLCDMERADMLVCIRRSRTAFARCMCVPTNCFGTGMSCLLCCLGYRAATLRCRGSTKIWRKRSTEM